MHFYSAEDRTKAVRWPHDYHVQKIVDGLDDELPTLLGGVGVGLGVEKLLALLTSWNAGIMASLLGIGTVFMQELIELTSDMPDDVASQICNGFASGSCETAAKDSDAWETPGRSLALETSQPDSERPHHAAYLCRSAEV